MACKGCKQRRQAITRTVRKLTGGFRSALIRKKGIPHGKGTKGES